jgi:hypothetical protein
LTSTCACKDPQWAASHVPLLKHDLTHFSLPSFQGDPL